MPTPDQIHHFFDFASTQLDRLVKTHPGEFPLYTTQGRWDFSGERWTNWCEGFLGGQLWLLHLVTGEQSWRDLAEQYSRHIAPRRADRSVHDLGFLFWPTWKRWYDLTGDPATNTVVVEAGQTLAMRFNEKGRYLRSFLASDSLFIDIMMNVGIIFYAAGQLDSAPLRQIAMDHCLTTRRFLVRGDGSTAHEGIFDLESGAFLRQSTQQGWRADSCWARGLAWALYGFSMVYRFTNDPRFLETAEMCARFYMEHTPEHGVPPNDYDDPDKRLPYESSAAAIAAGGFLNLAECLSEGDKAGSPSPLRRENREVRSTYRAYALRILDTLLTPEFLADQTPGWEGLLKHGMYHQRKSLGVDESVMWGDYFLMEALYRVREESTTKYTKSTKRPGVTAPQ